MNDTRSDSTHPALAETVADLQMRLTYQDEDLRQLNAVVLRQQAELDEVKRDLQRLRDRLEVLAAAPPEPAGDERPPHY